MGSAFKCACLCIGKVQKIDSLTVVTPEGRIYTFLYCLNFYLFYAYNYIKIVTLLISLPPYTDHYTDYSLIVTQK